MSDLLPYLIGVAWVAILALLALGIWMASRNVLGDRAALPFFGMLRRTGLSLQQLEDAAGFDAAARAVRRCALCRGKEACRAELHYDCPNAALLQRAKRLSSPEA